MKFRVRVEWKTEEWHDVEASTAEEAESIARNAPIENAKSLGIQTTEVYNETGQLVASYF